MWFGKWKKRVNRTPIVNLKRRRVSWWIKAHDIPSRKGKFGIGSSRTEERDSDNPFRTSIAVNTLSPTHTQKYWWRWGTLKIDLLTFLLYSSNRFLLFFFFLFFLIGSLLPGWIFHITGTRFVLLISMRPRNKKIVHHFSISGISISWMAFEKWRHFQICVRLLPPATIWIMIIFIAFTLDPYTLSLLNAMYVVHTVHLDYY